MDSVFPWLMPGRARVASPPGDRWASFLEAMSRTTRYRGVRDLRGLDAVSLETFFADHGGFRNDAAPGPRREPIALPWDPQLRVAAVAPWFRLERRVEVFMQTSPRELESFRTEILAAPLRALRCLAVKALQGRLRLPHLRYGVLVFSGLGFEPPRAWDRELFWRAFQAPVFTQLRGLHGELLAFECEAHRGLHVRTDQAVFEVRPELHTELLVTSLANLRYPVPRLATGMTATIEHSPCGCGLGTPRLRLLRLPVAASCVHPR
ncbi:MAG: hypothetical protein ACRD44_07730 [Bryobacteraceae bacterium]